MSAERKWPYPPTTTASTSTTGGGKLPSLEELAEMLKTIPKDPFYEWMVKAGASPDDGWYLVLPTKMAPDVLLPRYVKLPNVIAQPMFVRDWS